MDEEIRRAYHLFLGYNNRKATSTCAQKFKVPRWAINRRAAMLDLARIKELEWNPAQVIEELREPRSGNERHVHHRDRTQPNKG